MKIQLALLGLCLLARSTVVLFVNASEDEDEDGDESSGSGSGDEAWNSYGEDDDFYSFVEYGESSFHWSDYAIYPEACLVRNKKDLVVFSMYAANHNGCNKKSMGKYYLTVAQYVLAVSKSAEKSADLGGYDYDEPAAKDYLACNEAATDDGKTVYTKLGCDTNNWEQFSIKSYSDQYCTIPLSGTFYYNTDLTDVAIDYKNCNSCSNWQAPDDDAAEVDDQFEYNSEYFSPLCTAAWYYKQVCDSSCMKAAKIATGEKNLRSFTLFQMFQLFVLSGIGVYFFLQVFRERRKMSEEDAMYEEASVASVGIKKDNFPKIFLGYIVFIFFLIIFKVKRLTFIILIITDVVLIMYFSRLQYRSEGKVELGGYHIYGDREDDDDDRSGTEMT